MISYGSLMSHALQWTQFAALICKRRPPWPSATISYTPAGQKFSHGLPNSLVQRVTQIEVSCTFRWTGCASSWTLPAKNTEASRSRGGNERSPQPRSGEVYSSSFSSADQSSSLRIVQGTCPLSSETMPALNIAKYKPRLNPGLNLRTACSSRCTDEARDAA